MGPKRTFGETLFDTDSGSSGSSSDAAASGEEEQEYFYETLATDPATGRPIYTSSIVSAAVSASPSKPARVYPPSRTSAQGTWIYDFMDNDWAFAADDAGSESEEAGTPPPSESLSDAESVPKKRTRGEPVCFFFSLF
jgi:hypothetical protein